MSTEHRAQSLYLGFNRSRFKKNRSCLHGIFLNNFNRFNSGASALIIGIGLLFCFFCGGTDSMNPDSMNPDSMNPDSMNPDSMNPDSMNPDSMNPDSMNPDSMNPDGGGSGAVNPNSYICENGTKKAGDVPSGSSDADKMICTACNTHYRLSGTFGEADSTCVARTCAVEGEEPCSACYVGSVRSGHRSDGTSTLVSSESTCVQVDSNNNKLIDITTLTQLHNMRHNLAGTSYKTVALDEDGDPDPALDPAVTGECGTYGTIDGVYMAVADSCKGYELMNDLSFDLDGDDDTYTGDQTAGYILDNDDNAPYFIVTGDATNYSGGWLPIDNFATTFEGNHKTITGLAIRRTNSNIGMFGSLATDGVVRNIHLDKNLAQYTGSASSGINVGGLVGKISGGTIVASSTTGDVHHGASENANVGGLVGALSGGNIVASYATGKVSGAIAGGLVGNSSGIIIASFARGDVVGTALGLEYIGGLVGSNGGVIIASHASGNIDAGGGGSDFAGGLAGYLRFSDSKVVASIATGSVTKGSGATNTRVGALVGFRLSDVPLPVASYGFGAVPTDIEDEKKNTDGAPPSGVTSAAGLTAENAGSKWNLASEKTLDAWFFEAGKAPKLQFADYDGDGTVYSCSASESTNVLTTIVIDRCGTLIPGQ